jgi:hypothetical protein
VLAVFGVGVGAGTVITGQDRASATIGAVPQPTVSYPVPGPTVTVTETAGAVAVPVPTVTVTKTVIKTEGGATTSSSNAGSPSQTSSGGTKAAVPSTTVKISTPDSCRMLTTSTVNTLNALTATLRSGNSAVNGHAIGDDIVLAQQVADISSDSHLASVAKTLVKSETGIRQDLIASVDPSTIVSNHKDLTTAGDDVENYCATAGDPLSD